jgi:hypothetical protein
MDIVNKQKERYIKKNKYTDLQIKKLFNRIKYILPHLNNDLPKDDNEWDILIKQYIIPACKYISQNAEKELKECKQNAINDPTDYDSIKLHNYILQQKKLKWNGMPYDKLK